MRRPQPPPLRCGRLILTPLEVRHKDRLDWKYIGTGMGIMIVLNLVAGLIIGCMPALAIRAGAPPATFYPNG